MKLVIDLSHWEEVDDWDAVKALELDGVYLKATQGAWHVDNHFEVFRAGFRSIGVPWGAYHFYDPAYSGLAQSSHFASALGGDWGDLPPCLDFEPKYIAEPDPPRTGCLSAMKLFLNDIEMTTGIKPIIYTNPDHINFLKPVPDWLLKFNLWIASYTTNPPNVAPWADWVMWQFSEAGHVDGIDGAVDMNWAKEDFIPGDIINPEPSDKEKLDILWGWYKESH
jgi:lysozyme